MELRYKRDKLTGIIYVGIKPYRGRTKWKSLGTTDMKEAKKMAADANLAKLQAVETANALQHEVFHAIKNIEVPTTAGAVDKFLEHMTEGGKSMAYIGYVRARIMSWLRRYGKGDESVLTATQASFHAYYNEADSATYATRALDRAACIQFGEFCVKQKWWDTNRARAAGIDKTKMTQGQMAKKSYQPFTDEEVKAIVKYTQDRGDNFWCLATMIGWEFGLRLADVCTLERVSLSETHLQVCTRKTRTYVKLPLSKGMIEMLNSFQTERMKMDAQFIFPMQRAEYITFGASELSGQFTKICKALGIKGKSFHSLRTSYIKRTYQDRLSLFGQIAETMAKQATAEAVGHKSTATTDIYLNA